MSIVLAAFFCGREPQKSDPDLTVMALPDKAIVQVLTLFVR
ncbi:MAG: hypothetical protein AAF525_20720 [Pseudomonadota bacterium]